MSETRAVLYGRAGCHLCDVAREVVAEETRLAGTGFTEIDVDTDPQLQARYGEYVPVVTVDDVTQGYWQIDPARLRAALRG
ncbi:glutaredoxin family protein [Georgenia sp. MJ170]|uniref:glutaredoxin family protein n=1 Tax=Georgenia sunbinii TaxID=3117728 RepID=UPI002F26C576